MKKKCVLLSTCFLAFTLGSIKISHAKEFRRKIIKEIKMEVKSDFPVGIIKLDDESKVYLQGEKYELFFLGQLQSALVSKMPIDMVTEAYQGKEYLVSITLKAPK